MKPAPHTPEELQRVMSNTAHTFLKTHAAQAKALARVERRVRGAQQGQSKMSSFMESLTNVAIGYGISLVFQVFIFHQYGITTSLRTSAEITFWFTLLSIVRSYLVRRWYNSRRPAEK